jgi:hypothetical protein
MFHHRTWCCGARPTPSEGTSCAMSPSVRTRSTCSGKRDTIHRTLLSLKTVSSSLSLLFFLFFLHVALSYITLITRVGNPIVGGTSRNPHDCSPLAGWQRRHDGERQAVAYQEVEQRAYRFTLISASVSRDYSAKFLAETEDGRNQVRSRVPRRLRLRCTVSASHSFFLPT